MSALPRTAVGFLRMVREARRDFTAIGAVAPSSQALARALASRALAQSPNGLRILEVGSGTGPVTKLLLSLVYQGAVVDVLEPNPAFASHLRDLAAGYPQTATADAGCVNVHQSTLEDFVAAEQYDIVIAGLPLKNFGPSWSERCSPSPSICCARVERLRPSPTSAPCASGRSSARPTRCERKYRWRT